MDKLDNITAQAIEYLANILNIEKAKVIKEHQDDVFQLVCCFMASCK